MRTFSPVAESLVIALACAAQTQAQVLRPIGADDLCVSNGEITRQGGELKIDTASSRAELRYPTAQTVEIRFTYRGPSYADKPLASGEIRRQIGLKLRAFNQCNLVYAMWHIEPDTRVAVSVKRNPGMSTHEQCLANGYVNLGPTLSGTPPPITPGSPHVFRAELHGAELLVTADGHPA